MLLSTQPQIKEIIGIPLGSRFCPRCNGRGEIKIRLFDEDGRSKWKVETCPYCNGKAHVTEEEFNKYWKSNNKGLRNENNRRNQ